MGTRATGETTQATNQSDGHQSAEPRSAHAALSQVRQLIASGAADPRAIASLIRDQPESREQVYALLHQVIGNQFVVAVEAELAKPRDAVPLPGGGNATAPRPRSPSGSPEAMAELQAEIAASVPHPNRIPSLIPMLTYQDLVRVRDEQLTILEAKLPAAQVIAVYQALGETANNTARAAIRKGATARDLARLVSVLDADGLVELADEPGLLESVRAGLPGAFHQYTGITLGWPQVAQSGALVRWFVESSTAEQIWRHVASAGSKPDLVATLEREQLWDWVALVSPHGLSSFDASSLREIVKLAPPIVKPAFEALLAASPGAGDAGAEERSPAQLELAAHQREKARKDAASQLQAKLSSTASVTSSEILDAVAHAEFAASLIANDVRARKKVVAVLDAEQLSRFVSVAGFSNASKLDWLLEKPGAATSYLVEVLRETNSADALRDETRTKRLAERLGDDLDLSAGLVSDGALRNIALRNPALRSLLLGKQPAARQLLAFVIAGSKADDVAEACKVVAKDYGYAWVYELTNQVSRDEDLRRLAVACPDRAARQHLANFGVRGWALEKNPTVQGSIDTDLSVYKTDLQRMHDDVASNPAAVAADAIEMSDADRSAMRRDRGQANAAITAASTSSNMGMDAVRTARELDGTLAEVIRDVASEASHIDHSAFRTYARERSASEQIEVAGNEKLASLAEKLLAYSPVAALPALRTPSGLAQALSRNPGLLGWIERTTSAVEVIELLGANDANAKLVARIMETTRSFALIRGLPQEGLTVGQRAALARIGAEASGKSLHEAVGDRLTDNADNDTTKRPSTKPDNGKNLPTVLDELIARGASPKDIQAACAAHSLEEAKQVLIGGAKRHFDLVRSIGVSPLTIFAGLAGESPEVLYGSSVPLTDWLLGTEEPLAVLRAIAGSPKALRLVAVAIDADKPGANRFLTYLPSGHGLSNLDEVALSAIYTRLLTDSAALRVFSVRFGSAVDGEWSRAALNSMWGTLSRLPDRQVEANLAFGGLSRGQGDEDGQLGGKYTPGTGVVTLKGDAADPESRYENRPWQRKEQLGAQLGVDGAEIDRRVTAGRIETKQLSGVDVYRTKSVVGSKLTYTLLHEMGHAVDALLGSRTELAYAIGGWRVYDGGDFDGWAAEMGGWSGGAVSPEDKVDIKGAFEQYLQSSGKIQGPTNQLSDLAPSDHALRKRSNQGAFLPAMSGRQNAFKYGTPTERNGRMYLMNFYYGKFMSYDAKIHGILPLPYAGFAPEEFFAECYVEYYRDETQPGGNLPMSIKTWFDENVNRIGHGPSQSRT